MLDLYVTTFYDKQTFWGRILKTMLPKEYRKRASGRRNPDLDDDDVLTISTFGGMLEAMIYRINHGRKIYRIIQHWNSDRFGKRLADVAKKHNADAVVLYDSTAAECFERLRIHSPETLRILDVSIGVRPYQKKIFTAETIRTGRADLRIEKGALWNEQSMRRYQRELELADAFLAPSVFVQDSLSFTGISSDKIFIVPYGANLHSEIERPTPLSNDPISFLFVGRVSANKGIPLLVEALRLIPPDQVRLTITGQYDPRSWFVREAKNMQNVRFTGIVLPQEMKEIYEQADVFVLPSFAEGMSLAGLEAMACALPIICTTNTGVNDYVVDGESGFVIPAGDPDALVEKLQWCIAHRDRLVAMGNAAREAVRGLTWSAYETNAAAAIRMIIEKGRGNAGG